MIAVELLACEFRMIFAIRMLVDIDHDQIRIAKILFSPIGAIGDTAFDNRFIAIWHDDHLAYIFPRQDDGYAAELMSNRCRNSGIK